MKRIMICIAAVIILMFGACFSTAFADGSGIQNGGFEIQLLQAGTVVNTMSKDETFTLKVLSPAIPLTDYAGGAGFTLSFDPDEIELVSIDSTDLPGCDLSTDVNDLSSAQSSGMVVINSSQIVSSMAAGDAVIEVTIIPRTSGSASISFTVDEMSTASGSESKDNYEASVSSTVHVHQCDSGVISKKATPYVQGQKTFTCTSCGETFIQYYDYDGLLGDISGDAKVDNFDATMIRRHLSRRNILTEDQLIPADTNNDVKVNNYDATRLRLYIARKIESLYEASNYIPGTPDTTATGDPYYTVVTYDAINDATVDISQYLGASVQFIRNERGEIVGVGEVESTFIEGRINNNAIDGHPLALDGIDSDVIEFINGVQQASTTESTVVNEYFNAKFAVILDSSGAITRIVSRQTWTISNAGQIAAGDLDDINLEDEDETGCHTLFGYNFAKNNDNPATINTSAFILEGVDSLSDIKKGDVVYVYDNGSFITKIQVGQLVIEGELSAINSNQTEFTIGGTVYKLAGTPGGVASSTMMALLGKTISANLDINGRIYACAEVPDETRIVHGVLLTGVAQVGTSGNLNYQQATIRIFNEAGETADYLVKDNVGYTADQYQGELVCLTLDSNNVVAMIETAYYSSPSWTKIPMAGVVDGDKLLTENTVVFNYTGTTAADKSNTRKYSVIPYTDLLGETPTRLDYFSRSSKITYAIAAGLVGRVNDIYAVVTGYSYGSTSASVNAYVDGEAKTYTADNDKVDVWFAYNYDPDDPENNYGGPTSLYKLTVNNHGKITAAPIQMASKTYTLTTRSTAGNSRAVKIEGGYVVVAEDIAVYIYNSTNHTWTANTGADALVGLKVGNMIDFYDTDSTEGYEIAIVTK